MFTPAWYPDGWFPEWYWPESGSGGGGPLPGPGGGDTSEHGRKVRKRRYGDQP